MNDASFITRGQALKMLPFTATARWLEEREALDEFPKSTRASSKKIVYRRDEVEKWVRDFLKRTTVEPKDDTKPVRARAKKKREK